MKTKGASFIRTMILCSGALAWIATAAEPAPKTFGKGSAFTVAQLPDGKLKEGLQTLSPASSQTALAWLNTFSFGEMDAANHLRVDPNGGVYMVCPDEHGCCDGHTPEGATAIPEAIPNGSESQASNDPTTALGPVPVSNPPPYNSKPGATHHIYLDFNGAVVSGTAWNTSRSVASWNCAAWSSDGDLTTFSADEQADMRRVWERISEDFAPFDVNVTTEVTYDPDQYTGDKNKVGWLLFTPTTDKNNVKCPHDGSGGVAYVGVYGDSNYHALYQPAWVKPTTAANMSEAGSHEMGHNMGLSHDGTSTLAYYGGHAGTASSPSWGPIMGTGYGRDISQWSKGEYTNSNQSENDLMIISGRVPYRADDHGDSFATATQWADSVIHEKGVVETTENPDVFCFVTGAGAVSFNASGYKCDTETWGGNLDMKMELFDSSFALIASDNPAADTSAAISRTLAAGTYYLVIKPVAAGNPLNTPPSGYKIYGSLGKYKITGQFVPPDGIILTSPNGGELWAGGTTKQITWATGIAGNIKIELLKQGVLDSTIVASTPNDGSYDWSIPIGQAVSAEYRVRITSVETPTKTDTSNFDFTISPTALPEIGVEHPVGTALADGVSTLEFGTTLVGSTLSKTITIRNTGTASLTGLAINTTGANAADFSVTTLASTSLAPGQDTTFDVTFAPSATGNRIAALEISSNDSDENPFNINLSGVSVAPEIVVEYPVGTGLTDEVSTADAGAVWLGYTSTMTFKIRNSGTSILTNLAATLSGTNQADFTLSSLGTNRLSPGTEATFTVTFAPLALGARTATLRIASNDSDENPFDINLTGSGEVALIPDIVVEQPADNGLISGTSDVGFGFTNVGTTVTRTFTIRNTGITDLTGLALTKGGSYPADFALGDLGATTLAPGASTTFSILFTPSASGSRTATLQIASNDPNENPFHITLSGSGVIPREPEIVVEQPAETVLENGSSTVAFGVVTNGESTSKTFTIRNAGLDDLTDLALSLSGTNSADFSAGALETTSLAPGASTTFTVTFSPSATGDRSATLHINSNSTRDNPFDIALSGSGTGPAAPMIVIEQPAGTSLTNGVSSVSFGSVNKGSQTTRTFKIRNTGTANLSGLSAALTGANAADFVLGALGAPSLTPNAETTLTVTFAPVTTGGRNAKLQVNSNDPDNSPFEITLSGTGLNPLVPEISVEQPAGTGLSDGTSAVTFGNVHLGQSASKVFTIRNSGSADLRNIAVSLAGFNTSDFTVASPIGTSLAPGAHTTFTVTFTPAIASVRNAVLKITSNDSDENPFDIALSGTGTVPQVSPEIVVKDHTGNELSDGSSSVAFGSVEIGASSTRTFTIRNTGTSNLSGISVSFADPNTKNFTIGIAGSLVLKPGEETTFSLTFAPSAAGEHSAAVRIASNDLDENPFNMAISGTGVVKPDNRAPHMVVKLRPDRVLSDLSIKRFRSVRVGSVGDYAFFTIENTGNAALKDINVRLGGLNPRQFKLIKPNVVQLAPGKKATFRVAFSPKTTGFKKAILYISGNDPENRMVRVKLQGTGT